MDQADGIAQELRRHIRTVPDFPTAGISFKDITPLIEHGEALHEQRLGHDQRGEKAQHVAVGAARQHDYPFRVAGLRHRGQSSSRTP